VPETTGSGKPGLMASVAPPRWRVPLADVVVSDADIAAVADVYRSGWLSQGPLAKEFEAAFAAYTGAPCAVAVTNCTAALHLMAMAAGLAPGDEVIMPSLTFVATANAVAYTGATPVFAVLARLAEPSMDPVSVRARITPRTKAIMSMPYGGHPGETLALAELAEEHGLLLLEDAAHALGSRIGERHLGTFGWAGAYSFFSNKNLTVGEGGMVVCPDEDVAARLRLLRSHGMTTLSWDRHRGHATGYDVVARGHNFRIDEARCALGLSRLGRLEHENGLRAVLDRDYRERLRDVPQVEATLVPGGGGTLAHHLFTVVLAEGIDRDATRRALAEQGVQTSVHYPPAHRFQIFADAATHLPVTDAYAARAITLPMYAHMTEEQVEIVTSALAGAVA
jgi:dTDP-4-amino-4,6-dideoxygalactose transaminase